MIVVYRAPNSDWFAVARRLRDRGLVLRTDYRMMNERCYIGPDHRASGYYAVNERIRADYAATGKPEITG